MDLRTEMDLVETSRGPTPQAVAEAAHRDLDALERYHAARTAVPCADRLTVKPVNKGTGWPEGTHGVRWECLTTEECAAVVEYTGRVLPLTPGAGPSHLQLSVNLWPAGAWHSGWEVATYVSAESAAMLTAGAAAPDAEDDIEAARRRA